MLNKWRKLIKQWTLYQSSGPILGTAVHAGHAMRDSLLPIINLSNSERRYEEDPMTQTFLSLCDHVVMNNISRFEVDLNRERSKAIYLSPDDAWGLNVWKKAPDQLECDYSLKMYDDFYAQMKIFLDQQVEKFGKLLVLDFHSFNMRKSVDCPDIDLGFTTFDKKIFGTLATEFERELSKGEMSGKPLKVEVNNRYPDGGNWPEWIYKNYSQSICTITLEYRKIFMDEKAGLVDISKLDELHDTLARAVKVARRYL